MDLRTRKKNRLENYDYSQNGLYFITICTKNRIEYFGKIENANVCATIGRPYTALSDYGMVVEKAIKNISDLYNYVFVDKYVIMPNHVHLILRIENDFEFLINGRPMVANTVSDIINQMKGYISKKIGFSVWQKSFHDRIIRNENEYNALWNYIENNPLMWKDDCFFVQKNQTNEI